MTKPPLPLPDRRRHAYRPDLAEQGLEGRVPALRYVEGIPARICRAVVPGRLEADHTRPRDTEYLMGEPIRVFEQTGDWAWIKSERDGYVGYIDQNAVVYETPEPTHRVTALRSHLYPAAELKRYAVDALTFGAQVTVIEEGERWAQIADGQWIYASHLSPIDRYENDSAAVALRFLEAPYLWGGRSSEGLDCSALIQFALEACGIPCPRDTDMQEAEIGTPIDPAAKAPQRGDLVFWPGHVGIMIGATAIVHSNATDMKTRVWTLVDLEAHIKKIEGNEIRCIKRIQS